MTAAGCTDPVPNSCSRPALSYWQKFDSLISTANQNDVVPLIAGLVDPLDTATSGAYPRKQNAVAFSRFLAARMAGFAVLYSPGFDDNPAATTADVPPVQLTDVMNAVGFAVKQATPRLFISMTNHLSGNATCTDYENFRNSGWMTSFFFQSGHAKNPNGTAGTSCPGYLSSERAVSAAMRRAWQMPWTLSTNPTINFRPSYNAEGPYDEVQNDCVQTPGCLCANLVPPNPAGCHDYNSSYAANYVDIRYHVRQAAYLSSLSGAYGFTYGVSQIGYWSSPTSYLGRPSATDIGKVYSLFRTRAGIAQHRDWIANQVPDSNSDDKKMALASDGTSLVLAYMPAYTTVSSIQISTNGLPGLGCSGWTFTWMHAQDLAGDLNPVSCTGVNPISVAKPSAPGVCSNYKDCDWVLQIQKTKAASTMAQLASSGQGLNVWADLSPNDGTSAIYGGLPEPGHDEPGALILLSPDGVAFQQSPVVSRFPKGYLVVWHADSLDGSLLGVFARVLDRNGQPVGERFQVNSTTEHDQRDPSVDSDPLGNSVIVWTSYGQDGDMGGIYGRLLDASGNLASREFQVNTVTPGHQGRPQVAFLPGGNFVVGWQTEPMGTAPGALSFRVFSRGGTPLTNEIRNVAPAGAFARLVDLMGTSAGGLQVRWALATASGASLGTFMQQFSAAGLPAGPPVSLP